MLTWNAPSTSKYKPAVGKYLTIGPRCKVGRLWPCNKLKSFTSVFSSWRDDCGWDRMEKFWLISEPIRNEAFARAELVKEKLLACLTVLFGEVRSERIPLAPVSWKACKSEIVFKELINGMVGAIVELFGLNQERSNVKLDGEKYSPSVLRNFIFCLHAEW